MTTMTAAAPTMQAAVFEPEGRVALRRVERPRREPGGVLLRVRCRGRKPHPCEQCAPCMSRLRHQSLVDRA